MRIDFRPALAALLFATLLAGCSGLGEPIGAAGDPEDAERQYVLGTHYMEGRGVAADPERAVALFRQAAESGHPRAQYQLAVAYAEGNGVAADPAEAARWFEAAAEQGHARAQFRTGEAYMNGRGVPEDRPWGARWFGKAAEQGLAEAQFALGVAFAAGLGLPVDRVQAYRWLTLAQEAGHPQAGEVRGRVREAMNAAEVARAVELAKAWRPAAGDRLADAPTVRFAQMRLAALGFDPGPADGLLGPRTDAALAAFRRSEGLPQGGGLTAELLERLRGSAGA